MLGVVAAEGGYRGPEGEKKGGGFLLLDNGRVGLDSLRRSMGVYLRIEITPNRVWIWASGNGLPSCSSA